MFELICICSAWFLSFSRTRLRDDFYFICRHLEPGDCERAMYQHRQNMSTYKLDIFLCKPLRIFDNSIKHGPFLRNSNSCSRYCRSTCGLLFVELGFCQIKIQYDTIQQWIHQERHGSKFPHARLFILLDWKLSGCNYTAYWAERSDPHPFIFDSPLFLKNPPFEVLLIH